MRSPSTPLCLWSSFGRRGVWSQRHRHNSFVFVSNPTHDFKQKLQYPLAGIPVVIVFWTTVKATQASGFLIWLVDLWTNENVHPIRTITKQNAKIDRSKTKVTQTCLEHFFAYPQIQTWSNQTEIEIGDILLVLLFIIQPILYEHWSIKRT